MRRRAALATLLLAVAATPGSAQVPGAQVTITGRVKQFAAYTIQDLAVLPNFQVQATTYGNRQSTFIGAMLWPLIVAASPLPDPAGGNNLDRVVFARAADGTEVAVAIAEIDPDYEGKPVLIAYKQDGALLPAPRLVVPGDRRAGRNVPNLTLVEIR